MLNVGSGAGVNVALIPSGLTDTVPVTGTVTSSIESNREELKGINIDSGSIYWLAEVRIYKCMYGNVCRLVLRVEENYCRRRYIFS